MPLKKRGLSRDPKNSTQKHKASDHLQIDNAELPAALLSRFNNDGLSLSEAIAMLSDETNIETVARVYGKDVDEKERDFIKLITPLAPGESAREKEIMEAAINRAIVERAIHGELKSGRLVAYGFLDGEFSQTNIKNSEWFDRFFFTEENSAIRTSTDAAIKNIRILRPQPQGPSTPAIEARGRKPRPGMNEVFGALVLHLAEHGYPGGRELTWGIYMEVAEKMNIKPLSYPQFRKQSIDRLGLIWWNTLGKDEPDLK